MKLYIGTYTWKQDYTDNWVKDNDPLTLRTRLMKCLANDTDQANNIFSDMIAMQDPQRQHRSCELFVMEARNA